MSGFGLLLLVQLMQITHGAWVSTSEVWPTTIRATATMSGVSGRVEAAILAQRSEAYLAHAGLREAGIPSRREASRCLSERTRPEG